MMSCMTNTEINIIHLIEDGFILGKPIPFSLIVYSSIYKCYWIQSIRGMDSVNTMELSCRIHWTGYIKIIQSMKVWMPIFEKSVPKLSGTAMKEEDPSTSIKQILHTAIIVVL